MAWDTSLARRLVLNDGRELVTLLDAAGLFAGPFEGVERAPPIAQAIEQLVQAAESGDPGDIKAATEQVTQVLAFWKLMR